MRLPVAVIFFAFGYALAYYGFSKFTAYQPKVTTTELGTMVAPLGVLLALVRGSNDGNQGFKGTISVPFALQAPANGVQRAVQTVPNVPTAPAPTADPSLPIKGWA